MRPFNPSYRAHESLAHTIRSDETRPTSLRLVSLADLDVEGNSFANFSTNVFNARENTCAKVFSVNKVAVIVIAMDLSIFFSSNIQAQSSDYGSNIKMMIQK